MRNKAERSAEFAKSVGDAIPALQPPEGREEEYLVDREMVFSDEKTPPSPTGRVSYEKQIQYERYMAWPGWGGAEAWRVVITLVVSRKDIGWSTSPTELVDFPVWGKFCETRQEALADAEEERRNTRTF